MLEFMGNEEEEGGEEGLITFLATTFLDLVAGLEKEEAILAGAAAAGTAECLHAAFVLVAAALGLGFAAAALCLITFLATTFLNLLAGLEMEEAILAGAAAAGTAAVFLVALVGLLVMRGIAHTAMA